MSMNNRFRKVLCLVISAMLLLSSCSQQTAQEQVSQNTSTSSQLSSEVVSAASSRNETATQFSSTFIESCNYSAGGYLHYSNGKYYYADLGNKRKLYTCDENGKNIVCIDPNPNDILPHIRSNGSNIYYLRAQKLEESYKINEFEISFDSRLYHYFEGKTTLLSDENVISYDVCDEYVFYSTADLKVYRMKLDGSEKKCILESSYPREVQLSDGRLYLHGEEAVFEADYDGNIKSTYNIPHYQLAINYDKMYYVDLNSFNIMACKNDSYETVVSDETVLFTIYKDKIIYQAFDEEKIYSCDLDDKNIKYLCDGENPLVSDGNLVCLKEDKIIKIY